MHIELLEKVLPMQHFVNKHIAEAGGVGAVHKQTEYHQIIILGNPQYLFNHSGCPLITLA